jgi:phage terminase large subunit-like protein
MVESDPTLLKMCQVQDYKRKITFLPNKCSLTIKSFDPAILTGTKPAGVLLDELHVIAEHSAADRVLGQLRGGLISQPEAFLVTITTQSERVPSGVFRQELMKARRVRDGEVHLKMLPIIYELPEAYTKDNRWEDPKCWPMVTPNNGRSITIDRLKEDFANAKETGGEELRRWASQHLNIEIGLALKSNHWVGAKFWPQTGAELSLENILQRSDVITLGIDGGGLDDMLGFTVCGRDAETGMWLTWSRAWIHSTAMEQRKSEIHVYKDFIRDGDLILVEHLGEDVEQLGDLVEQCLLSGKLNKIGVDPSGLGGILDELVVRGVDHEKQIVGIPQGWRLTSAIKTTERKLAEGALKHAIQPLMRWCIENARVEPRGNAVLITKQISGTAKIDPLMALLNSVELMAANPQSAAKYQMMFVGGD